MEETLTQIGSFISSYKVLSATGVALPFLAFLVTKAYSAWVVNKVLKQKDVKSIKVNANGSFEITKT